MANATVVTANHVSKEVARFVEEQIEFNIETLKDNMLEAAKASKHQLAIRTGSWVGTHRVGHDRGYHRKGWKIYRENWYKVRGAWSKGGVHSAVIASMIEPQITHLLEFGHNIKGIAERRGGYHTDGVNESWGNRTRPFFYISKAFEVGKAKLLEAKVDNP